jgi:hypothetical protein
MEDVPVFLSLFSAFLVGMLVTLPIAVRSSSSKTRARAESRRKRSEKRENKSNAKKGRRGLFRGNRGRPAHESGAVGEGGSTGDGPR